MKLRNPNGYGSVYKLSGNRRRPWAARKTIGFNEKGHPIYKYLGYYEKRKDALTALAEFNADPFKIEADITFSELFERWSVEHYQTIKQSNINGYNAAYSICSNLYDMPITRIKLDHLQKIIDDSGKNSPTLKKVKILFGMMYDYAVIHEMVEPSKREMVRYVNIKKAGNPNAYNREPFGSIELASIWERKDNEIVMIILIMIYSGCRIGELLALKVEDVHLDERWFFIKEAKTAAGVREVPIAEKIVPFFDHWIGKGSDYLFCNQSNDRLEYRNFFDSYWKPIMKDLGMESHRPHDTRHTCISLMTAAGVDERILKKIVGHKGQGVTEITYTHVELPVKLEAINRI